MANPIGLREEIDFWRLFNRKTIHQNNHNALADAKFDEEKYARGIHYINDNYAELYRSLQQQRPQVRNPVHALKRGFLINKGFASLSNAPHHFWCVTFDLYNRGNPRDPNGPRRLIAIISNWPGGQAANGRIVYSSDGGYFQHLVYSNNHYGDRGGGPSLAYVHNWPLKGYPAGCYSVMGSVAATFG